MESVVLTLPVIVIAALLLLGVGLGIGILMGRGMSADSQKYRETERRLDQVLQEKKAYEHEVVQHFSDTARKLNNLTESYREVHSQLAMGAATLCKEQGPVALGRLDGTREDSVIPPDLTDVKAPLDYAPKTSPGETGMLNEDFGLERDAAARTAERREDD